MRTYHFLILFLILFGSSAKVNSQNKVPKYNVLFIITDDMNEHCDFLGYPQVLTPNIDRLAKHGVVFTQAYAQFPLCSPSRTSLLTGWRPDVTKIMDNHTSPRSKIGNTKQFMPEYFHSNGYRTEKYGKILHTQFEKECTWDYIGSVSSSKNEDSDDEGLPGSWWITTPTSIPPNDLFIIKKLDSSIKVQKQ